MSTAIVDAANQRGLYVGLLPTWGGWVQGATGKQDERLLTTEKAGGYGEFLGKRYGKKGVIWILGGDRVGGPGWRRRGAPWRLESRRRQDADALMTFHPRGGRDFVRANFHNDSWLDFNMWQTGHGLAEATKQWSKIRSDWERTPVKPVVDGEPCTRTIRWDSGRSRTGTRWTRTCGSAPTGRCCQARADSRTAIMRCGRCTRHR